MISDLEFAKHNRESIKAIGQVCLCQECFEHREAAGEIMRGTYGELIDVEQ